MQIVALITMPATQLAERAGNAWWTLDFGQVLMLALTVAIVVLTVVVVCYARRTLKATRKSTNATKESLKVTRKSLEFFTEPRVRVDNVKRPGKFRAAQTTHLAILNYSPQPIVVHEASDVDLELLPDEIPERVFFHCNHATKPAIGDVGWAKVDDALDSQPPYVIKRKLLIPFEINGSLAQREFRIRVRMQYTYDDLRYTIDEETTWIERREETT